MRQVPLSVFVAVLLCCPPLHAEESVPPAAPTSLEGERDTLQQRLLQSEEARAELQARLAEPQNQAEQLQMQRLRQENQRLKLQLRETQAAGPRALLNEQQRWFAIGAGGALLCVLAGALLRGGRRSRREWIN